MPTNPYDPAESYYSNTTDPSNSSSPFARLRSRSMAVKPKFTFSNSFSNSFTSSFTNNSNNNSPNTSLLNLSTSSIATPVISDDDDDDYPVLNDPNKNDDDDISIKSHSTSSINRITQFKSENDLTSDIDGSNNGIGLNNSIIHPSPHIPLSSGIPIPAPAPMNRVLSSPSPSSPTFRRRGSADMSSSKVNSKRFFISDIDSTLDQLLSNEDTDNNCQITIDDNGPKVLKLGTVNSAGFNQYDIRGTYMLSNLLQELTIAKRFGRKQMILDEARLNENPVSRLKRLITTSFWKNLTRQVNESTILDMAKDTKIRSELAKLPRIYIPYNENEQFFYYKQIAENHKDFNLQVEYLPKDITSDFVKSINDKPGLLALAVRHKSNNYGDLEGYPYIVPGGRFNEQYGWDSYFETLGLLSCDILEPCIGMLENFIFEINHYGKILNANRSYYLCRSQPPFLTDMAIQIFDYINKDRDIEKEGYDKQSLDLLKRSTLAAIKEYYNVWMSSPRLDPITGLSTYHPDGKGIPPETEASHFHSVLTFFCEKYNLSYEEFEIKYNNGEINEPQLDDFFLHDRAVRESGHDTSYRLEGICANLATIDLNSLLFKYEKDISFLIKTYFDDNLIYYDDNLNKTLIETSKIWNDRAETRRNLIDKYMWNEKESLYFDYNIQTREQSTYESVTAFYTLWAGVCSNEKAEKLVNNSIKKFEEFGGLVSGTCKSRGEIGISKPSRQWDYPFAWAPHQIIVWEGLNKYNYHNIAQRLAYRWLYLMTLSFVDFNGIVVEKYDATSMRQPHKVDAEYGNQGSGFKGVATEGFGWVNASYLIGLKYLDRLGQRALGMVTSPIDFFQRMNDAEKERYGLI